jgi:recombination protein U
MTNKKLGNDFESELCEMLFKEGFWVHNFAQNQSGQPADIIAVKNGQAFLIDAKVCSDNKFPLSRIEENQKNSMELWKSCRNGIGWFALKIGDEAFMIAYSNIKKVETEDNKSSLTLSDIVERGMTLRKWVEMCH